MDPVARHTVRFGDCPAGEFGATWAQQNTWQQLRDIGDRASEIMNVPLAVEVDDPVGVTAVLAALRLVVARHDALRTRYREGADGALRQVVAGAGELAVAVYEAGSEAELPGYAERMTLELKGRRFAPEDLPLSVAVITVDGSPRRLALAINHLSVDGWGSGVVYDELRSAIARAAGRSTPPLNPAPWQPRDQVAFEASDRGRRRSERALGYWRRQLEQFPVTQFPGGAGTPEVPRFRESLFESAAVSAAAYALARRSGTSTAAVLLAGYAMVVAHRTQRPQAYLAMITPNRTESRTHTAVCNLYHHVPITVDVSGVTFERLPGRATAATIRGYRNGQCDPVRLAELLREVRAGRGGAPDMSCLVNLHLQAQSSHGEHRDRAVVAHQALPDTPEAIADLTRHSTFRWRSSADSLSLGLYLAVWAVADTATMSLWGDTAVLPSSEQHAVLTDLERVLVEAVAT